MSQVILILNKHCRNHSFVNWADHPVLILFSYEYGELQTHKPAHKPLYLGHGFRVAGRL